MADEGLEGHNYIGHTWCLDRAVADEGLEGRAAIRVIACEVCHRLGELELVFVVDLRIAMWMDMCIHMC